MSIHSRTHTCLRQLFSGLLILVLCLASGCSDDGKKPSAAKGGGEKRPVPVTVGHAELKTVPREIKAIGIVEPYATVAVKSQITGVIESVHFREGDEVKQGDLLFSIDPRPFLTLLNQAEGTLARDMAELNNARSELQRYAKAASKGYVSTEAAEQARTKDATLTATVKADEAAVENAKLQLDFCSITSPIDGHTGEVLTDRGNLVKANADTPMVTINQVTPVKVAFSVPGDALQELKKYYAANSLKVLVRQAGGPPLEGRFIFLDNSVDPTTGTIRLKAEFANAERILWPGLFVEVVLRLTERENTVTVPTAALQLGQSGTHVFVVTADKTVTKKAVVTGPIVGAATVIEEGLQGDEEVVTDGQLQLRDGAKIAIRTEPSASSDGGKGGAGGKDAKEAKRNKQ